MTTVDRKEAKRLMKAEKEASRHSMARNQISRGTNVAFNVLLIVFCILIIFPLWIIVISSITSEQAPEAVQFVTSTQSPGLPKLTLAASSARKCA